MSLGGTVLLRRQRQTLQRAEKQKRILSTVSRCISENFKGIDLPESDAQAPDSLHLIAYGPICAYPIAIDDVPSIILE